MADPFGLVGQLQTPYTVPADNTPRVTIEVTHGAAAGVAGGAVAQALGSLIRAGKTIEYRNIEEYSYNTDILTPGGDPFTVRISNIDGRYSGLIVPGDTVKYYIEDPRVGGGNKVPKMIGIVTAVDHVSTAEEGSYLLVSGADLGWHLANNTGQLFMSLKGGITMNQLIAKTVPASWGFTGTRQDNAGNRKLKQGGAYDAAALKASPTAIMPIQFEPGQTIIETLITYARREKLLVNVSADGYLQLFSPDYTTPNRYGVLHYHKATEQNRTLNNVEAAKLSLSIDGVYTKVRCVGQNPLPGPQSTVDNPNENRIVGKFDAPSTLPFPRELSFSDSEQTSKQRCDNRAKWKWQRGQFDSWVYTATVKGHSMNGLFLEPDTIIEINDTVNAVTGSYYISACRYERTMQAGTKTTLTIHKMNVMGA